MEMDSRFCDTCRPIKLEDYFCRDDNPGTVELGRFQDIARRTQCPLCSFVIKAFNLHTSYDREDGTYLVEMCYLGRTWRYRNDHNLQVWFESTPDTSPTRIFCRTIMAQILCLAPTQSRANEAIAANRPQYARLLGEKVDISLIRGWIRQCTSSHGSKCDLPRCQLIHQPDINLILVDVRRLRLVESTWDSRYMALSYVWGQSKSLKCTKANIGHLRKDGSLGELKDELPLTIRDAISLTDALGESYLWVDALCIIQDDDSKGVYISRMDQIYSNACVTLVALTPNHAASALPGVTQPRNLIQTSLEINSLHLISKLPQLHDIAYHSTWNRRAWTFQEGIFSRRCLYFGEHQVFWQCRTSYHSEDYVDDHKCDTPLADDDGIVNWLDRETGNNPSVQFAIYKALVTKYSTKDLTFPHDALNAFSGILSALSSSFGWKLACALPESHFDLALLWGPQNQTPRPRWASSERRKSISTLPSWCWTAWNSLAWWDYWRLVSFADHDIIIKTEIGGIWIHDSTGTRQIRKSQAHDRDTKMSGPHHWERELPPYTLFFQAKTINIEAYAISEPRLKLSVLWKDGEVGDGMSNYYRIVANARLWIYDATGQHCGTIHKCDIASETKLRDKTHCHDLVKMSRSTQGQVTAESIHNMGKRLGGVHPSDKEYYEEVFDTRHYCYKSDWAINIMLIRWEDGLAERVAVGQIHSDAWNEELQKSTMITLI